MQRFVLCSLSALLATSLGFAQGVQPLSGTYRVGTIGDTFSSPFCGFTSIPQFQTADSTLMMQSNGSFSATITEKEFCPGGTTTTIGGGASGPYAVDTRGILLVDFDPSNPGEDTSSFYLSPDGTVGLEGRVDTATESYLSIAVKLSSGKNNGSLNGAYHFVRLFKRNNVATLTTRVEQGVMTFNGAGAFSETGTRHAINFGGITVTSPHTNNGSYTVVFDGNIVGPNIAGALSPDRELFYWLRTDTAQSEAELVIGVRQGSAYPPRLMSGDWGFVGLETDISASGAVLNTDFGILSATPETPSGGNISGFVFNIETSAGFNEASIESVDVPYLLQSNGTLDVDPGEGLTGGLSASGRYFIVASSFPEGVGLFLGSLRCAWPDTVGIATPGSGGISPLVTPTGGFSYLGNAGYGVSITSGLGGSAGVLMFSVGTSAGFPFSGGTLWLDPALLLTVPVGLSGSGPGNGTGGVSLPIPATPSFEGQTLAVQGFVADGGAPAGLSMTPAIVLGFCR